MALDTASEQEYFLEKECPELQQRHTYPRDCDRRRSRWISIAGHALHATLCVLLAVNLAAIITFERAQTAQASQRSDEITMRYESAEQWMSLDHKYDHLWTQYGKGQTGLVRVDSDGTPGQGSQWGGLAMFHQLHCMCRFTRCQTIPGLCTDHAAGLAGFRTALQRAREGIDIGIDTNDDPHWPHCLWYMRQAIHCAADATIEMPGEWSSLVNENNTVDAIRVGPIDGKNDLRRCGNADALYRLRAEHGVEAELAKIKGTSHDGHMRQKSG